MKPLLSKSLKVINTIGKRGIAFILSWIGYLLKLRKLKTTSNNPRCMIYFSLGRSQPLSVFVNRNLSCVDLINSLPARLVGIGTIRKCSDYAPARRKLQSWQFPLLSKPYLIRLDAVPCNSPHSSYHQHLFEF